MLFVTESVRAYVPDKMHRSAKLGFRLDLHCCHGLVGSWESCILKCYRDTVGDSFRARARWTIIVKRDTYSRV